MPAAEGRPWDEHVAVGAAGVDKVSLLQDHYCIPHVAVYKVDLEIGSTR